MFPINLSLNWLAVPAASTLAIYALLSPWNLPLYDQIVFLRPPVDTPDVSAELKELSKLGVEKKEVALRSANGRLIHGWFLQLPGPTSLPVQPWQGQQHLQQSRHGAVATALWWICFDV